MTLTRAAPAVVPARAWLKNIAARLRTAVGVKASRAARCPGSCVDAKHVLTLPPTKLWPLSRLLMSGQSWQWYAQAPSPEKILGFCQANSRAGGDCALSYGTQGDGCALSYGAQGSQCDPVDTETVDVAPIVDDDHELAEVHTSCPSPEPRKIIGFCQATGRAAPVAQALSPEKIIGFCQATGRAGATDVPFRMAHRVLNAIRSKLRLVTLRRLLMTTMSWPR